MKSFVISLILFGLMLAFVLCNTLYIKEASVDLRERLDTLPPFDDPHNLSAVNAFCEYWDRRTFWVGLSVSYPVTDRLTEQAALLRSAAEQKDLYGYHSALTLLYDAIEDMERLEKISP